MVKLLMSFAIPKAMDATIATSTRPRFFPVFIVRLFYVIESSVTLVIASYSFNQV